MALPLVAIAAENADVAVDAKATVVSSCAGVIGPAGCVTVDDPLAPAARYLAVVKVLSERKLRVDLQSRADDQARGSRDLAFSSGDLGLEHWNSVGLVVAALVADAEQPAPVSPKAPPPRPAPTVANDRVWVRVGVGAATAPGFDFDPWRVGPTLSVSFGAQSGLLYPVLTTRWLASRGHVRSDVTSAALGLGARLIRQRDILELGLEAAGVAETLLVSLSVEGRTEQSFRVRYGARLGLASSFKITAPFHAYAGVDVTWLSRRGVVEVTGKRLGTELHYFPGFEGGIRLTF